MLNQVTIQGRLTADPELKSTGQGTSVTSFTLACDRDFPNGNGDRQADFIDCVAWRVNAEFICRNFHKGKMMIVSGRLQKRDYMGQDGKKHYVTEVVVEDAYFAGDKSEKPAANDNSGYGRQSNGYAQSSGRNQNTYQSNKYQSRGFQEVEDDSELPF